MSFDSEFIFFGSFIRPKIEYFSSIKAFIYLSFNLNIIYIFNILKKKLIYHHHDVNCDNNKVDNFFKLNENEICITNRKRDFYIFEFIDD